MMEKYIQFIASHSEAINKSFLARWIGVSKGTLSNVIDKRLNASGNAIKLPNRCLPLLASYFEFMEIEL